MQNPFQFNLRFENFFNFFFQNINFFTNWTLYCKVEKHEVRKKSFLVLFYSAKSISVQFTIWELFQVFFLKKHQFFSLFRTLYCKGEKHEVRKKSFLVLFYSAKSISVQFTIWELFQFFFSKHQFFSLFRTLYCKGEKHEVRKKSFLVLFYSAKSISVQFTIENFFNFFFQNINFFTVSNPILQSWEAWGQKKIIFSAVL